MSRTSLKTMRHWSASTPPMPASARRGRSGAAALGHAPSHEDFRRARYFPELDGLRAVSILLVVAVHTTDPLWGPLHGNVGVTIFFVISGFIITTLLLREEAERGRVRIGAFYARRAFRILPVYYTVLAAYVVLIGILGIQAGADDLWKALPYFITYQNDLAHTKSGYGITWSLAIEEKFYLIWPLFFLPWALRARRTVVICCLAVAVLPFAMLPGISTASAFSWHYPAIYAPIIDGCIVAIVMHAARGYAFTRRLTSGLAAVLLLLAAAAEVVLLEDGESNVHVVFALLVALVLPACLTGPRWLRAILRSPALVYIGTRSYAVYLVHRLGKGVIDRVIPPGGSIVDQVIRLVLITAVALLGAEVLRRVVEQPMIRLGRRVTSRTRTGRVAPELAAPVDRPEHPVEAVVEEREPAPTPSGPTPDHPLNPEDPSGPADDHVTPGHSDRHDTERREIPLLPSLPRSTP